MPACPECLFGVGSQDTKCGFCGAELDQAKSVAAEKERFEIVPKPPYMLGESVIPAVLVLGGVAAVAAGGIFAMQAMGGEMDTNQVGRLTVMVSNGAMCLLFGLWSIGRQRARQRVFAAPPPRRPK